VWSGCPREGPPLSYNDEEMGIEELKKKQRKSDIRVMMAPAKPLPPSSLTPLQKISIVFYNREGGA